MDHVEAASLLHQKTPQGMAQDQGQSSIITRGNPRTQPKVLLLLTVTVTIYSFLLVFSWSIMCILRDRPVHTDATTPSWVSARQVTCAVDSTLGKLSDVTMWGCQLRDPGKFLYPSQLAATNRWRVAAKMITAVMAVLTIPFSSFIIARAAVVYAENASRSQAFTLRKMLALADRGWWNPFIMIRLINPKGWRQYFSPLLLYGFMLCVLGGLIWPLQQLVVSEERIVVFSSDAGIWLVDADITGLSQVQSKMTVGDTVALINSATQWDSQPNIWRTPDSVCNNSVSWAFSCVQVEDGGIQDYNLRGNSSFVSIAVNSATTGVLDGHSFRFNTSVLVEEVPEDTYPNTCGGPRSFSTSTVANLSDLPPSYQIPESSQGMMEFKVCAPGDSQRFPWNMTRDRQDIEEEVYIQFNSAAMSFLTNGSYATSLTQRIQANTTAGYFMLPNYENNYQPGPLLETFNLSASNDPLNVITPSNDYGMNLDHMNYSLVLGYGYPDPTVVSSPALGPLLTATKALFGPSTFFASRANSTPTLPNITSESLSDCSEQVPFSYISDKSSLENITWRYEALGSCASSSPSAYFNDLNAWLSQLFANYEYSQTSAVFTQGVFFANKANLGRAATVDVYHRILFKDDGTAVDIFQIRSWAIILISVIIGLHIMGLIILAVYAGYRPTWTDSFDAFSMLRIGAHIPETEGQNARLLVSGHIRPSESFSLDKIDGLVFRSYKGTMDQT